jgi:hypothetical protein
VVDAEAVNSPSGPVPFVTWVALASTFTQRIASRRRSTRNQRRRGGENARQVDVQMQVGVRVFF